MDQVTIGILLAVGLTFLILAFAIRLKIADNHRRALEDIDLT